MSSSKPLGSGLMGLTGGFCLSTWQSCRRPRFDWGFHSFMGILVGIVK